MRTNFPGTLLKLGSADPSDGSSNSVSLVQQTLKDKNYLITVVDGLFGTSTELAVKAFQTNNKLQVDGIVGKVTWDALINGYIATYHAYPGVLIGYGSSGSNVTLIQEKLTDLGYNIGTIDGYFGNATKQAIISFQSQHGLDADGVVGQITWDVLLNGLTSASTTTPRSYPGVFYMIGSNGENVVLIQNRLNEIGYNAGTADGFFGQTTYNAVVEFQSDHGLDADGVIGESSWNILFNSDAGTYRPFAGILLGVGSANNDVKLVQEKLNSLGYNAGTADGIFGTGTETAVKNYQQAKGLDSDGIVGKLTWDSLFNGSTRGDTVDNAITYPGYLIGIGNADSNVSLIQAKLNELNIANLIVDGIFGASTENAIKSFQTQNSLTSDGIVGKTTWDKLFEGVSANKFVHGNVSSSDSYAGSLLSIGSSGAQVTKLQNKLFAIGYTQVGVSDGIFGEQTRNAVIAFQHDRGLVEDGIVGSITWNAIFGTEATSTVDPDVTIKRIFIDAGHGGTDPGAVGNGLNEKDITLRISLKQKELFEAAGYTVFMSRTTDTFVSLSDRTTQANNLNADLLISNHVNAGGGTGSEVWCSIYGGTGRVIAERVCNNLSTIFANRGVKTRQGEHGDYLHMIRESKMPAILIEHGFIDNVNDANKLRPTGTNSYVDQMAQATVDAVMGVYTPSSDSSTDNIVDKISAGIAAGFDEPYGNIPVPNTLLDITLSTKRFENRYGYVEVEGTLVVSEDSLANIEIDVDNQEISSIKDMIVDAIMDTILDGAQTIDSVNAFLHQQFGIEWVNFTGLGDITEIGFENNIIDIKIIGLEFISSVPNTTYKLKEEVSWHITIDLDDLADQLQNSIQRISDMEWALIACIAAVAIYVAGPGIIVTGISTTAKSIIAGIFSALQALISAGYAIALA